MATRRPDLEAVEVNPMFSYIGDQILPPLVVNQKTGKYYAATIANDVAAQTGRTMGDAPTTTNNTVSATTYTVVERINRQKTADSEVALMGGLPNIEALMNNVAKRSIMRANEDLIVAATINDTDITHVDIMGNLRGALDTAIDTVHQYPGRLLGACGYSTYRNLSRTAEVTNTLLRTSVVLQSPEDVRYVTPITVATILGLDDILVGDDDHWTEGKLLVFKQPNASVHPMEVPQFGRLCTYVPDDGNAVQIESWFSDDLIAHIIQARAWNQVNQLNLSAAYVLLGIDDANAVTTSTTSTTTA